MRDSYTGNGFNVFASSSVAAKEKRQGRFNHVRIGDSNVQCHPRVVGRQRMRDDDQSLLEQWVITGGRAKTLGRYPLKTNDRGRSVEYESPP
jgi:hypothetical protein